jgi:nitrous oxide reductase accessory protein NosL
MESKGPFMKNKILLLGFFVLVLAGCATSTRYVSYTPQRFSPKDELYAVKVYPESQALNASKPYYVIGKISIEGFASNGVNPGSLTNQAKEIAKKRGADAIINARTQVFRYYYGDELLRFIGELIVYAK